MITLSRFAALRSCELAGLSMRDVTEANGEIATEITISPAISKYGRGRRLAMSPRIYRALVKFRKKYPEAKYLARSSRYPFGGMTPNAVSIFLHRLYKRFGLDTASSHSGRRSCLTDMLRTANKVGASPRDVQIFAGHARLDTTAIYIEPSMNMRALVEFIGRPSSSKPEART